MASLPSFLCVLFLVVAGCLFVRRAQASEVIRLWQKNVIMVNTSKEMIKDATFTDSFSFSVLVDKANGVENGQVRNYGISDTKPRNSFDMREKQPTGFDALGEKVAVVFSANDSFLFLAVRSSSHTY